MCVELNIFISIRYGSVSLGECVCVFVMRTHSHTDRVRSICRCHRFPSIRARVHAEHSQRMMHAMCGVQHIIPTNIWWSRAGRAANDKQLQVWFEAIKGAIVCFELGTSDSDWRHCSWMDDFEAKQFYSGICICPLPKHTIS